MPGEANSIFLKEEKVGPVELATISFGQRFEVTPMQMVKMVGTIANKGVSITPRLVKSKINSQTQEKTDFEIKQGTRVISEETADKVLSMMESVVADGTGRNAQVKGYAVGGKTGTSEDGVNTNKYITSFIGVADANNPKVVILIVLYNPTGEGGHQGGAVAAPIASEILGEVLPYLDGNNGIKENEAVSVTMPGVTGMPISEAKEIIRKLNLEIEVEGDIQNNQTVIEQIPKTGIQINEGTKIILKV